MKKDKIVLRKKFNYIFDEEVEVKAKDVLKFENLNSKKISLILLLEITFLYFIGYPLAAICLLLWAIFARLSYIEDELIHKRYN